MALDYLKQGVDLSFIQEKNEKNRVQTYKHLKILSIVHNSILRQDALWLTRVDLEVNWIK